MRTDQEVREKPRKRFECNLCDHKATTKFNLARHRLTHTGQRPYPCDLCNHKATTKQCFVRHCLTHTGERPYNKCDVCVFSANQKDHLITHIRVHSGEKPFECEYCSYRRGDLTQHMRTCKERPTSSK